MKYVNAYFYAFWSFVKIFAIFYFVTSFIFNNNFFIDYFLLMAAVGAVAGPFQVKFNEKTR